MDPTMALVGEAQRIRIIAPGEMIATNMLEAVALCIQESQIKYKLSTLADILGIDKARLSKAINAKGYNYPLNSLPNLMRTCGNYAVLQQLLTEMGFSKESLTWLIAYEQTKRMGDANSGAGCVSRTNHSQRA